MIFSVSALALAQSPKPEKNAINVTVTSTGLGVFSLYCSAFYPLAFVVEIMLTR